jgi:hypothetical protein
MLELIKAALWPAIALIAIILFYSPIRSVLDNVASRASDIQQIKLGSLELSIKVSDLPIPDSETARAIVKLNDDTVVELLFSTGEQGRSRCYNSDPLETDNYYVIDEQLSSSLLITLTKQASPQEWCKNEHAIALTTLGTKVKDYLLKLLMSQIRKSGYSGSPG